MSQAVFLDLGSTSHADLDLSHLNQVCESITYWDHTSLLQRIEHIGKAEIIITNKVLIDAPILEALQTQIKLICIAATGTNNVDLVTAKRLGIPVTNIRHYANQSVAEHTLALIFTLRRQIIAYRQALQQGAWQASPHFCLLDYPMPPIAGSTLAILGYGTLGQAVAQLARQVSMQILLAEQPNAPIREGRVSFEQALAQADVLSLHCPLTEQTRHLMNAERLQQMKSTALLINTARGGIVDEVALVQALKAGWIGGAGIDVLAKEPPDAASPLLQVNLPNLIVTPHVAWASQTARQTLVDQLASIIQSWQQGKLINLVS